MRFVPLSAFRAVRGTNCTAPTVHFVNGGPRSRGPLTYRTSVVRNVNGTPRESRALTKRTPPAVHFCSLARDAGLRLQFRTV